MNDVTRPKNFEKSDLLPDDQPPPMEVPWEALAPETLEHLAREVLLREMDHNHASDDDAVLAKRVAGLLGRIKRGEFILTFDPASESVGVSPANKGERPTLQ